MKSKINLSADSGTLKFSNPLVKSFVEYQTSFIVMNQFGKLDICMIRETANKPFVNHDHCNAKGAQVGDVIFWHRSDFNMTRIEGEVLAIQTNEWNYRKPIGDRGDNYVKTENWDSFFKQYYSKK